MSSAVNGLGSSDQLALINSLIAPASTNTPAAPPSGVSAQQELTALQKNGDLTGLLSDNIAVGVMQIANSTSTSSLAGTSLTSLVSQLISAYTSSAEPSTSSSSGSAAQQSAATLSTNPGLAIIQEMENAGTFSPTLADATAAGGLSQITG
ncbi:MAG: hypothetical protein ABSF98_08975 [Bryobacteraceae bacterium]|jgi:hypothetical protein